MKFTLAAVLALAACASAAPKPKGCTPGTYACTPDALGWQVCNTSRKWVFAGTCPPETSCKFYEPSHSPYCVPAGFKFP
ncbi:Fc.00g057330.m01.CDS01 [Cosmosporella sp. VM-42]